MTFQLQDLFTVPEVPLQKLLFEINMVHKQKKKFVMIMILLCIYPQTTGLLWSTLGNLSAMVDCGDSRDDAESLLHELKEFAEKSVVSSLLKDLLFLQCDFFLG